MTGLKSEFRDKSYRDEFVSAGVDNGVAYQILVLRNQRGWTQQQLGTKAGGGQQPGVARWERPGHDFRLSTLKKIASALDVGLIVRFVPFSEVAQWSLNLGPGSLEVPSFADDPWFIETTTVGPRTTSDLAPAGLVPERATTDNIPSTHEQFSNPAPRLQGRHSAVSVQATVSV